MPSKRFLQYGQVKNRFSPSDISLEKVQLHFFKSKIHLHLVADSECCTKNARKLHSEIKKKG